jgi:hypothetical protein
VNRRFRSRAARGEMLSGTGRVSSGAVSVPSWTGRVRFPRPAGYRPGPARFSPRPAGGSPRPGGYRPGPGGCFPRPARCFPRPARYFPRPFRPLFLDLPRSPSTGRVRPSTGRASSSTGQGSSGAGRVLSSTGSVLSSTGRGSPSTGSALFLARAGAFLDRLGAFLELQRGLVEFILTHTRERTTAMVESHRFDLNLILGRRREALRRGEAAVAEEGSNTGRQGPHLPTPDVPSAAIP